MTRWQRNTGEVDLYLENMRASYRKKRDARLRERHVGILIIVGIALILAAWCLAEELWAGEVTDPVSISAPAVVGASVVAPLVSRVDAVLVWWARLAPRNPLRVESYRADVAAALVDQAAAHGLPVELVTAMTLRESSGAQTAVGRRGEIGLMQVHPGTAVSWRCHLGTPAEQIDCGCRVLAHHLTRCGTLRGALAAYGSRFGKCKPKPGGRVARMVANRMRLADVIKKMLDRE
jgi:hypothetical protein